MDSRQVSARGPENPGSHGDRDVHAALIHHSGDEEFDNTALLLDADDDGRRRVEFTNDQADSPMPMSPASSRSSRRSDSLSSEGSNDLPFIVGSAPETRHFDSPKKSLVVEVEDKSISPAIAIPKHLQTQKSETASSLPTAGQHDKRKRDSLQIAKTPQLKSILKRRRNSVPTNYCKRNRTSTTFRDDCADGEKTEGTRLLTVEQSDESRRVSYSLPEGYVEDRQSTYYRSSAFRVYNTRFYVLFIYCAFGFIYGALWNSLGPVAKTAENIFHFDNRDIALIANWGPIGFTLTLALYTIIIQRKGLRWACIVSANFMFIGAVIRCLVQWKRVDARWFLHSGYFCIGLARFMAQVAAPVLSATWFKAEQRTTATAIAVLMPQLGMSLFAAIEPYIIEELRADDTTTSVPMTTIGQDNNTDRFVGEDQEGRAERVFQEIMVYMYIQLFLATSIYLAMWIYFPARPPTPPTRSASVMRMTLRRGFRMAYRNRNFWVVAIPANAVLGVLVGWVSLLELNLKRKIQAQQYVCGWLIFGNAFGGLVAGVLIARLSDRKASRMKPLLLTLMILGFFAILLFTLQVNHIMPTCEGCIYASCVSVGIFFYAALPLICEISAELAYPVQEHVALVINIIVLNIATFLYLLAPLFPALDIEWLNWSFLVITGIALPIIACYKQKYMRVEHDNYLLDEGIGTHKVDEWLRKEHLGSDEGDPLAKDMNWVDDTRGRSLFIGSSGSIQDEARIVVWDTDRGLENSGIV